MMALVALMEPRRALDGIVACHAFTKRVSSQRNSKIRKAGTVEKQADNISAQEFLNAWKGTVLPALKRRVDRKHII